MGKVLRRTSVSQDEYKRVMDGRDAHFLIILVLLIAIC